MSRLCAECKDGSDGSLVLRKNAIDATLKLHLVELALQQDGRRRYKVHPAKDLVSRPIRRSAHSWRHVPFLESQCVGIRLDHGTFVGMAHVFVESHATAFFQLFRSRMLRRLVGASSVWLHNDDDSFTPRRLFAVGLYHYSLVGNRNGCISCCRMVSPWLVCTSSG